jgi:hypothetical protein
MILRIPPSHFPTRKRDRMERLRQLLSSTPNPLSTFFNISLKRDDKIDDRASSTPYTIFVKPRSR